jgi:hypothetical protein
MVNVILDARFSKAAPMSKHVPLTPKQKNSLYLATANPMAPPPFAMMGPANPKMRVLTVHFDGTQNDKDNIPHGEIPSLVAESHHLMNVNDRLASLYYSGVGTKTNKVNGLLESVTGMGASTRAEKAYRDVCEQVKRWREEDPDCEVHVHVVGFSRGAGTGVHFMNLLHDRGIRPHGKDTPALTGMEPGEVKSSAVLLDAVTTGNLNLKLTLPESNLCTLHLTAGGEERLTFPLTTLKDESAKGDVSLVTGHHNGDNLPENKVCAYLRLQEIVMEGARHSDVGGTYAQGDIRKISKYLMAYFQRSLGLPVSALRPSFEEIMGMHANDSRFKFNVNMFTDPFRTEEALIENRQSAQRTVINRGQREWSGDVSLSCHLVNGPDVRNASVQGHCYGKLNIERTFTDEADAVLRHECSTPDGQIFQDEDYDRAQQFTIKRNKETGDIEILGGQEGDIAVDASEKLSYRGLPFPEGFSLNSVKEHLRHVDPDDGLMLDLVLRKSTPIFDVGHAPLDDNQSFDAQWLLAGLRYQKEPWPVEVRNIVMQLNDSEGFGLRDGVMQMKFRAMQALSNQLMCELNKEGHILNMTNDDPSGIVTSIRIKSNEAGGKQGPFQIEMTCGDGRVVTSKDRLTSRDFEMITGMEKIEKAMALVCSSMERRQPGTALRIDQVFHLADVPPDLKDKKDPLPEAMRRRIEEDIATARAHMQAIQVAEKTGQIVNKVSVPLSDVLDASPVKNTAKKASRPTLVL